MTRSGTPFRAAVHATGLAALPLVTPAPGRETLLPSAS